MKQSSIEWIYNNLKSHFEHDGDLLEAVKMSFEQAKAMERELVKESCIMAIMQWHEWDKTNYLDLYNHKIEGAEIWSEDYCKELYGEIEVPKPNL